MKAQEMQKWFNEGYGMDAVYEIAAGNMGLFCVAFFGWKGKKGDKAKLNRLWNRIVTEYHKEL